MRIMLSMIIMLGCLKSMLCIEQKQKNIIIKHQIKWEKLDNINEIIRKNPKKKILLFIYTNWCLYCKKMEKETLSDQQVIKYINDNYISVKINAETKDILTYKGQKYAYSPLLRINRLAYYLLNGDMSYPSTLFIDRNTKITILKGFINSDKFIEKLRSIY